MLEGRSRVEPDFQDVGAFGVVVRFVTGLVQDVVHGGAAPGLDAAALHHLGGQIQNFHGARMQLAGIFVQKKRHGNAPAALARNAPVRPVGNHVAQAGFAVFGVELGLLDGVECQLAQGFGGFVVGEHAHALVHAHEPLGGGAVNHRGFMAPAMRVAVRDRVRGHQAAGVLQGFQNDRHGFPDVLSAEQREVSGICAVTLDRVQDVVVGQPICHAGVEIFHAIGGRRMDDAGAVVCGGVIGQVDRRSAGIARVYMGQWMVEFDQVQLLTQRGGHDAAA